MSVFTDEELTLVEVYENDRWSLLIISSMIGDEDVSKHTTETLIQTSGMNISIEGPMPKAIALSRQKRAVNDNPKVKVLPLPTYAAHHLFAKWKAAHP